MRIYAINFLNKQRLQNLFVQKLRLNKTVIFILTHKIILPNMSFNSGIFRDKTMDDEFIYIPNDDKLNYSSCRLKSVEQFEHY